MANPSDSSSIGSVLLIAPCIVALLPAALLAGWLLADHRAGERAGAAPGRAAADAEAFGDALDRWLTGTLDELRAWSEIPVLVEGVRRAAVEHHERGYTEETPEQVNALLVHDGNLGLAPQADEYLAAQVERSQTWMQVHYTDEYGFTVGVVGIEDDFVQTDETWWRRAWAQGTYEGPVGLDPTIGELGIRLALRIDDPATHAAVGVMDGTIGVAAIHRLADAFAQRTGAQFRILNADGNLVAETESGHARDRVLKLSQETIGREGWRIGVGSTVHSGEVRDGNVQRGWVRLTETDGPHRDWIVIAERRADSAATATGGVIAAVAGIVLAVVVGIAGRGVAAQAGGRAPGRAGRCHGASVRGRRQVRDPGRGARRDRPNCTRRREDAGNDAPSAADHQSAIGVERSACDRHS